VLLPFAAFADPSAIEAMGAAGATSASSSQAVLSLSIRDLKDLGQMLLELHGGGDSTSTSIRADDRGTARGKSAKPQAAVQDIACPLHRSDAIYAADLDVFAQTDILEARRKKK
jgi:hypothetical protein